MRSQHIWKEKDDDGRKREVRVTKFGGVWRFQAKHTEDEIWTYYDRPLLEDLRNLRDVIFRKYQRRRASAEDLASVEKLSSEQSLDSGQRLGVCRTWSRHLLIMFRRSMTSQIRDGETPLLAGETPT